MNTIKRWLERRRFQKTIKGLRTKQLMEVNKYIKRVYSPLRFETKPKNRHGMSENEMISFNKGVHAVYNPGVAKDYIEIIDIEDMEKALT